MWPRPLTTAGRLSVAFALILVATTSVSVATVRATARVRTTLDEVAADQEAERAGYVLAGLAREEYLHQAHILLNRDDSHLGHYRETVLTFRTAFDRVARAATSDEEKQLLATIRGLNDGIHRRLEDTIMPAIRKDDQATLHSAHEATEREVDQIVSLTERLNASFEARIEASKARAIEASDGAFRRAVAAPVAIFVIAIIAGTWIVVRVTRPLKALGEAAQRVGSGDLSSQIVVTGRDEFGALSRQLNKMVQQLREHHAQRVQSEKLAALGRIAAAVAHDLNDPLGVILGYVQLLRRRGVAAELDAQLAIIEEEAAQCQRLVEGLRDHVRPLRLDLQLTDVGRLVKDVVLLNSEWVMREWMTVGERG